MDFLREGIRALAQAAMDLEHPGAERFERIESEQPQREWHEVRPSSGEHLFPCAAVREGKRLMPAPASLRRPTPGGYCRLPRVTLSSPSKNLIIIRSSKRQNRPFQATSGAGECLLTRPHLAWAFRGSPRQSCCPAPWRHPRNLPGDVAIYRVLSSASSLMPNTMLAAQTSVSASVSTFGEPLLVPCTPSKARTCGICSLPGSL